MLCLYTRWRFSPKFYRCFCFDNSYCLETSTLQNFKDFLNKLLTGCMQLQKCAQCKRTTTSIFSMKRPLKLQGCNNLWAIHFLGGFLSFWTCTYLLILKHLPIKKSNFTQKHTFLLKCNLFLYANSDCRGIPVGESTGFSPPFLSN